MGIVSVLILGILGGASIAGAIAWRIGRERERRRHEADRIDLVTGIPNRKAFVERLDAELASRPDARLGPAVVYLNLDNFRAVHETRGAAGAAEVLRTIGTRLRSVSVPGDFVAHIGGDEFAVVRPAGGDRSARDQLAARLLDAVRQPQSAGGREIVVTAGVGISHFPEDGQDADALVSGARAAMKRAKAQGRDVMRQLTSRMKTRALLQHDLEQALRGALARNEFEVHYQPIVDAISGEVRALEALLRWRHPERGLLLPGEFVELAEETGLLIPIGEWVLREACRAARGWRDAGFSDLTVSVNVSARQLQSGSLVHRAQAALEAADLPPSALTIEITETVATSALPDLPSQLRDLATLGVRIALDDFGTGYASLTDLTRLPIHEVKLDQSFVRDALTSPKAEAIARGVLALGKSLRLDVVAEGVEIEGQAHFLTENACPSLQGFLYSKALPEAEILALLGRRLGGGAAPEK